MPSSQWGVELADAKRAATSAKKVPSLHGQAIVEEDLRESIHEENGGAPGAFQAPEPPYQRTGLLRSFMMRTKRAANRSDSRCRSQLHNHRTPTCPRLATLVKSKPFEAFVGVTIFANCITTGLDAEMVLNRNEDLVLILRAAEQIFSTIFLAELIARTMAFGMIRYRKPVSCLDAALVLITFTAAWIVPAVQEADADSDEAGSDILSMLSILRVFRLVRLLDIVRRHDIFKEVWQLVNGFRQSLHVLIGTTMVILFITYVFAIYGVVLISAQLVEDRERQVPGSAEFVELDDLMSKVGSLASMMYTLFQVLTLDSWNAIARPMMKYVPWCWLYFYMYIAVAVWVLMNLVTAVIVDGALKTSKKDEDALLAQKIVDKQKAIEQFRALFARMDVDGDGELTMQEFQVAFEDPEIDTKLRLLDLRPEQCREFFALLDTGDGVLSLDEFFEGVTRMDGMATSKDLFRVMKLVEQLLRLFLQHDEEVQEDLRRLGQYAPQGRRQRRRGSLRKRAKKREGVNFLGDDESSDSLVTPQASLGAQMNGTAVGNVYSMRSEDGIPMVAKPSLGLGGIPSGAHVEKLESMLQTINDARTETLQKLANVEKQMSFCNLKVERIAVELAAMRCASPVPVGRRFGLVEASLREETPPPRQLVHGAFLKCPETNEFCQAPRSLSPCDGFPRSSANDIEPQGTFSKHGPESQLDCGLAKRSCS